jgi:ribose transport system substrate-binding protein
MGFYRSQVVWRCLLCLVLLTSLVGCSRSAGPKRIIFLTNGNSPFWDAAREGLKSGERELLSGEKDGSGPGVIAVMEINDGTPDGQISKLRQFASQGDIIGVAVSALDADNAAVADLLRQLRKQGVGVITVDADVNPERFADAREFYVGTDNYAGGQALGVAGREILRSRGHESGSYVQFVGRTGSDNARKRMDGFRDAVGDEYREADRMGDDLDPSRARENVRNAISNHQDLAALVGIWSYNAPAIVDVVGEKGLRENTSSPMTVVTFDAEPLAVESMTAGKIDAMVVQDPFDMGYMAVKVLNALHLQDTETLNALFPNRSEPGGDIYNTALRVVVPDQGSPLTEEMFDANTEFMTLTDFQAWLKKYNLQGS